jgi:hypothetical protein
MRNILSTQIVLEPETWASSKSKMSHSAFASPCGFGQLLLADRRLDHRPHSLSEIPSAVDRPIFIEPDGFIRRINHHLGRANSFSAAKANPRKRSVSPSKGTPLALAMVASDEIVGRSGSISS